MPRYADNNEGNYLNAPLQCRVFIISPTDTIGISSDTQRTWGGKNERSNSGKRNGQFVMAIWKHDSQTKSFSANATENFSTVRVCSLQIKSGSFKNFEMRKNTQPYSFFQVSISGPLYERQTWVGLVLLKPSFPAKQLNLEVTAPLLLLFVKQRLKAPQLLGRFAKDQRPSWP